MSDEGVRSRSPDIAALWRTVVSDDANLHDALRRVAETGCGLLTHCTSASVTIIEEERPITVGSTSDTAMALDDAQYTAGEGPCLAAALQRETVRIDDTASDDRWPAFAASAQANGIRSSLSVPIPLSAEGSIAGFNIYGDVVAGFTEEDEQLCEAFVGQASIVVSNAQAYWAMFDLSRNLTKAMQSRAVIEQAKGALMSTHRIDAVAAFDLLRERSQASNRKLRDIAADVVNEASREETTMAHRALEEARRSLGLSYMDVWMDFFALGGNLDAEHVAQCLRGDRPVSDSDYNVLAHALNERFQDRGQNNPLAYHPL